MRALVSTVLVASLLGIAPLAGCGEDRAEPGLAPPRGEEAVPMDAAETEERAEDYERETEED